jgi:hypothetical protein
MARMRRTPASRALAVAALFGCSLPAADKESDRIARAFYDEIRTGADVDRDPNVDPSLKTDEAKAVIAQLRVMLPTAAPTSVRNTGWNYSSSAGFGASAQLAHAYVYPDRTIDVETVMQKAPGQAAWSIVGFEAERQGATQGPLVLGTPPKPASDAD